MSYAQDTFLLGFSSVQYTLILLTVAKMAVHTSVHSYIHWMTLIESEGKAQSLFWGGWWCSDPGADAEHQTTRCWKSTEEMTMREIHKWLRQLLMILYERTETLNLNLFWDVQPSEIDESVV